MSIRKRLDHLIGLHIVFSLFIFGPATPVSDMIATGIYHRWRQYPSLGRGLIHAWLLLPTWGADEAAICWVANRDHPLNDTSGVLVLTTLGTLLLLDGSNNSVWSSGCSTRSSSPATSARLLESGNFVVQGQDDSTFQWQSFDYSSNVLLPGMKIGKNLWNGDGWYLSWWRSATDPGMGSYRYITELGGGTPENVMRNSNDGTKRYRTGPWNGERFDGVPEMASFATNFSYHYQVTVSPSEATYSYTAKQPGAPYSQVKLGEAGRSDPAARVG
ncbi:unnamed protein product [Miscanthus lutarioriparius]|uniref:non-specific serine/threonine protein kinase n=1 Tax=Miscanthus lutarioriparius TaxID=422564 RepID=A0A811RDG1_9POAL|nr:unnamed protein product [Miscanthus lutarioriparius]